MYYVMDCPGVHPIRRIQKGPDLDELWRDGLPIEKKPPLPLNYSLSKGMPGQPKAMYYAEPIPLMRDDLIQVLSDAGVTNIQFFEATIFDPDTQVTHTNFKAYNIVGLVHCADMKRSKLISDDSDGLFDVDFSSLYIDESKINGTLLFRLAENVSAIIVHENIKLAIESSKIPGFRFYGPGEWSG